MKQIEKVIYEEENPLEKKLKSIDHKIKFLYALTFVMTIVIVSLTILILLK